MTTHWPESILPEHGTITDDPLIISVRMPWGPRRLFGLVGPPQVERRIFGDPELNAHIDRVMGSLPSDKRGAKINVGRAGDGSIQGVIVVRLNESWSIQGGVQRETGGVWSGQVSAEWTF
jgi:hypothetical protein